MKRFGVEKPEAWAINHRFRVGKLRRQNLTTILGPSTDRMYVAMLVGTECGLLASYQKAFDSTMLKISLAMTDRPYVAKFAQLCGVTPPRRVASKNSRHNDVWSRKVKGLRALMILKEVLPLLLGEKLSQAERAIEFFSPTGYRKGRFSADEVWPKSEFPLRSKGPNHALKPNDSN